MTFHIYSHHRHLLLLLLIVLLENFGYRQINSWWRFIGIVRWLRGGKAKWGDMKRTGAWQQPR